MLYSNEIVKRLLKSELVKRGISIPKLIVLLNKEGLSETKSSISSKINRGTFSATFFLQCLLVIGCRKFEIENCELNSKLSAKENWEKSNKYPYK